jgi:hypothetical protein
MYLNMYVEGAFWAKIVISSPSFFGSRPYKVRNSESDLEIYSSASL